MGFCSSRVTLVPTPVPLCPMRSHAHILALSLGLSALSSITWVLYQKPWPCEFLEDWTPSYSTFYLYARVLGDN